MATSWGSVLFDCLLSSVSIEAYALGLLLWYTMNAGNPHGLLEGSITPLEIQASICLSMAALFSGDTGNGGNETSFASGRSGMVTLAS